MNFFFFILISVVPILLRLHVAEGNSVGQATGLDFDVYFYCRLITILVCGLIVRAFTRPKFKTTYIIPLLGFQFLLLMSAVFSPYTAVAFLGMPNYYEGYLAFTAYLMLLFAASGVQIKLEKYVTVSVFLVFFFACLQFTFGNILDFKWIRFLANLKEATTFGQNHPMYGNFGNANHLGFYCAIVFPFLFSVMLGKQPKERAKMTMGLPVSIVLVMAFLSENRGGWISVAITSLVIMYLSRNWIYLFLFGGTSLIFYRQILNRLFADNSRWFIWKNMWPLLKSTILLGKGPATFVFYYPQVPGILVDRPHSIYFQLWHAGGFVSLVLMGYVVLDFFYCSFRTLRDEMDYNLLGITMSVLGFLIAGIFTDSVVGVSQIAWIMLGSGVGLIYRKEKRL